jgi:hypothetical protein
MQSCSLALASDGFSGAPANAWRLPRPPSHSLALQDLTDLEDPAVEGCPLQPLEGLVEGADLPEPVSAYELLGLRERPVDDAALLSVEPNPLALRARVESATPDDDPRLDQLFVELLKLLLLDLIQRLRGISDPHPGGLSFSRPH